MPFEISPRLSGGVFDLNYIDFDGAERKIFRNCVDKLQVWGKSEALKKVVDITMYRKEE